MIGRGYNPVADAAYRSCAAPLEGQIVIAIPPFVGNGCELPTGRASVSLTTGRVRFAKFVLVVAGIGQQGLAMNGSTVPRWFRHLEIAPFARRDGGAKSDASSSLPISGTCTLN
jgi:hypothetical protein